MSNLNLELKQKDTVNIVSEAKKEFKHIGSMNLKRGHSLFKFNESTGEITLTEIKKTVVVDLKGKPHKVQKVIYEAGYVYLGALNKKNAQKRINNALKLLYNEK